MKKNGFYINLLFAGINLPFALQGFTLNIIAVVICAIAAIVYYRTFDPFDLKTKE